MEPPIVELGPHCGRHGPYSFYKSFKYKHNGTWRTLSTDHFFFANISVSTPLCIGEMQLVWTVRNNVSDPVSSLRLYFLPEQLPEGRQHYHGENEVIATEKIVIRVSDLLSWLVIPGNESEWPVGLPWPLRQPHLVLPEPKGSTSEEVMRSPVIVVSYSKYCRLMAMLQRLRDSPFTEITVTSEAASQPQHGLSCSADSLLSLLRDSVASPQAITEAVVGAVCGLPQVTSAKTKLVFCRSTCEHPEVEEHEFRCDYLAPNLKGRPRRKRPSAKQTESSESENDLMLPPPPVPVLPPPTVAADSDAVINSSYGKGRPRKSNGLRLSADVIPYAKKHNGDSIQQAEEESFLKSVYTFMKDRGSPIHRLPCLGFKQIDLYELYKTAEKLGGYAQICHKRRWKLLYDQIGGNPTNTSAATCTRKHYERLLLPFELHLKGVASNNFGSDPPQDKSSAQTAVRDSPSTAAVPDNLVLSDEQKPSVAADLPPAAPAVNVHTGAEEQTLTAAASPAAAARSSQVLLRHSDSNSLMPKSDNWEEAKPSATVPMHAAPQFWLPGCSLREIPQESRLREAESYSSVRSRNTPAVPHSTPSQPLGHSEAAAAWLARRNRLLSAENGAHYDTGVYRAVPSTTGVVAVHADTPAAMGLHPSKQNLCSPTSISATSPFGSDCASTKNQHSAATRGAVTATTWHVPRAIGQMPLASAVALPAKEASQQPHVTMHHEIPLTDVTRPAGPSHFLTAGVVAAHHRVEATAMSTACVGMPAARHKDATSATLVPSFSPGACKPASTRTMVLLSNSSVADESTKAVPPPAHNRPRDSLSDLIYGQLPENLQMPAVAAAILCPYRYNGRAVYGEPSTCGKRKHDVSIVSGIVAAAPNLGVPIHDLTCKRLRLPNALLGSSGIAQQHGYPAIHGSGAQPLPSGHRRNSSPGAMEHQLSAAIKQQQTLSTDRRRADRASFPGDPSRPAQAGIAARNAPSRPHGWPIVSSAYQGTAMSIECPGAMLLESCGDIPSPMYTSESGTSSFSVVPADRRTYTNGSSRIVASPSLAVPGPGQALASAAIDRSSSKSYSPYVHPSVSQHNSSTAASSAAGYQARDSAEYLGLHYQLSGSGTAQSHMAAAQGTRSVSGRSSSRELADFLGQPDAVRSASAGYSLVSSHSPLQSHATAAAAAVTGLPRPYHIVDGGGSNLSPAGGSHQVLARALPPSPVISTLYTQVQHSRSPAHHQSYRYR